MRYLLDTHVFLWLATAPERLGRHLAVIEDRRNQLVLSAASAWELAIKHQIGRLRLPEAPERFVPARMLAFGLLPQAILHEHALAVSDLPPLHRDPFDRLLVAQALLLGMTIVTADPAITRYPVATLFVPA